VPPELQPQAAAALSEIKAQYVNQLATKKTPKQVTDYMNGNREVMNRLFTPDEMANLRDYHNAVHVLATDTGYKGSAVQTINVEQKLGSKIKEQLLQKGAATIAGVGTEAATLGSTAGAAGTTAGLITNELLGQRTARKQAKAQAQAEQKAFENTQQRFVPIQDLIKK
jgi:uridine phosphorylase